MIIWNRTRHRPRLKREFGFRLRDDPTELVPDEHVDLRDDPQTSDNSGSSKSKGSSTARFAGKKIGKKAGKAGASKAAAAAGAPLGPAGMIAAGYVGGKIGKKAAGKATEKDEDNSEDTSEKKLENADQQAEENSQKARDNTREKEKRKKSGGLLKTIGKSVIFLMLAFIFLLILPLVLIVTVFFAGSGQPESAIRYSENVALAPTNISSETPLNIELIKFFNQPTGHSTDPVDSSQSPLNQTYGYWEEAGVYDGFLDHLVGRFGADKDALKNKRPLIESTSEEGQYSYRLDMDLSRGDKEFSLGDQVLINEIDNFRQTIIPDAAIDRWQRNRTMLRWLGITDRSLLTRVEYDDIAYTSESKTSQEAYSQVTDLFLQRIENNLYTTTEAAIGCIFADHTATPAESSTEECQNQFDVRTNVENKHQNTRRFISEEVDEIRADLIDASWQVKLSGASATEKSLVLNQLERDYLDQVLVRIVAKSIEEFLPYYEDEDQTFESALDNSISSGLIQYIDYHSESLHNLLFADTIKTTVHEANNSDNVSTAHLGVMNQYTRSFATSPLWITETADQNESATQRYCLVDNDVIKAVELEEGEKVCPEKKLTQELSYYQSVASNTSGQSATKIQEALSEELGSGSKIKLSTDELKAAQTLSSMLVDAVATPLNWGAESYDAMLTGDIVLNNYLNETRSTQQDNLLRDGGLGGQLLSIDGTDTSSQTALALGAEFIGHDFDNAPYLVSDKSADQLWSEYDCSQGTERSSFKPSKVKNVDSEGQADSFRNVYSKSDPCSLFIQTAKLGSFMFNDAKSNDITITEVKIIDTPGDTVIQATVSPLNDLNTNLPGTPEEMAQRILVEHNNQESIIFLNQDDADAVQQTAGYTYAYEEPEFGYDVNGEVIQTGTRCISPSGPNAAVMSQELAEVMLILASGYTFEVESLSSTADTDVCNTSASVLKGLTITRINGVFTDGNIDEFKNFYNSLFDILPAGSSIRPLDCPGLDINPPSSINVSGSDCTKIYIEVTPGPIPFAASATDSAQPGATPPVTTAPVGTTQSLAQELLTRGNISIAGSTNDRVRQSLIDASNGNTSECGCGGRVQIQSGILSAVIAASDAGVPILITSVTTGQHSSTSTHYNGTGLDIGNLSNADAIFRFFYDNRSQLNINQIIYSNPPGGYSNLLNGNPHTYDSGVISTHSNHIHISVN